MVKVGSLFVCDRCGKEYFYENNYEANCVDGIFGWDERNGKELCPDCVARYDRVFNNFFNNFFNNVIKVKEES